MIRAILLIIFLTGCSITHEYGHKPEIQLDNPYADKTKLKIKDGGVLLTMTWKI